MNTDGEHNEAHHSEADVLKQRHQRLTVAGMVRAARSGQFPGRPLHDELNVLAEHQRDFDSSGATSALRVQP